MSAVVSDSLLEAASDAAAMQADVNGLINIEHRLNEEINRGSFTPNIERSLTRMCQDIRNLREASQEGVVEALASFNRELRNGGVQ